MFADAFCLDLGKMVWEAEGSAARPPGLGHQICNSLCDDIESVPHHKVNLHCSLS